MARSIYKRATQVIGLNAIYLLVLNNGSTKHVCAREGTHNNGRGIPQSKLRAPESHCYVMYLCANCAGHILSIHLNISVCLLVRGHTCYNKTKTEKHIGYQSTLILTVSKDIYALLIARDASRWVGIYSRSSVFPLFLESIDYV